MDQAYREVAELIRGSHSFLVASHMDPDGDAVGCELAMLSFLKRLDKTVKVVAEDPIPASYRFLTGSDEVVTLPVDSCEVAIVVDSGAISRLGRVGDVVGRCPVIVNMDHHKSNEYFGHHNIVDTQTGACGEMVYRLLQAAGQGVTTDEAEALFVAILSDTGCFRFPTTTGNTLRIAADLLDLGVKPYQVSSEIYWSKSEAGLKLLGDALRTIEVTDEGKIATMELTRRMYQESGATSADAEGFANFPRSIDGVDIGILLREMGNSLLRISLRSTEGYDVGKVAESFGGGGHATAAGFRMEGDLEQVKREVRRRITSSILTRDGATNS